jgi:hypothetical protein
VRSREQCARVRLGSCEHSCRRAEGQRVHLQIDAKRHVCVSLSVQGFRSKDRKNSCTRTSCWAVSYCLLRARSLTLRNHCARATCQCRNAAQHHSHRLSGLFGPDGRTMACAPRVSPAQQAYSCRSLDATAQRHVIVSAFACHRRVLHATCRFVSLRTRVVTIPNPQSFAASLLDVA